MQKALHDIKRECTVPQSVPNLKEWLSLEYAGRDPITASRYIAAEYPEADTAAHKQLLADSCLQQLQTTGK